jgi:uncharacterized protein with NAD-binding domain and iron-sulfur cluster
MHADLQKSSNACLSKRVDFGQVSPKEYARFWGQVVAETVHSKRSGGDWENSNILYGIRGQPQFQKVHGIPQFICVFMTFSNFVLLGRDIHNWSRPVDIVPERCR